MYSWCDILQFLSTNKDVDVETSVVPGFIFDNSMVSSFGVTLLRPIIRQMLDKKGNKKEKTVKIIYGNFLYHTVISKNSDYFWK